MLLMADIVGILLFDQVDIFQGICLPETAYFVFTGLPISGTIWRLKVIMVDNLIEIR